MKFILSDLSEVTLPPTLYIEDTVRALNFKEERAPYSSNLVVSGDGRPVSGPLVITGRVYNTDDAAARTWRINIRDWIQRVQTVVGDLEVNSAGDLWEMDVLGGDVTIVPTILPRVLDVKIRLYPKSTELVTPWGL